MKESRTQFPSTSSNNSYVNMGEAFCFLPIDIGHDDYLACIDPESAFWCLVEKEHFAQTLSSSDFIQDYRIKQKKFRKEIDLLRFHLKPSTVYFNATERCNLNCTYCYIPQTMRHSGINMSKEVLVQSLNSLKQYFQTVNTDGRKLSIIFHGAEPFVNREAIFYGIEQFQNDFQFGIQTNGTLLDQESVQFLKDHHVSIGLSLDGATAAIADQTRVTWNGTSVFEKVLKAINLLRGYENYNVICTITNKNMEHLVSLVDFFYEHHVPMCMLNVLRCTLPQSRELKPDDEILFSHFQKALDRSHELFLKTKRKLIIANFANTLLSIVAPTARKLMCDISPCGGGRAFFAINPQGDLFPCSEFIGLEQFNGGNIFKEPIEEILKKPSFSTVTERNIDTITPCKTCAIRHFCGAPCPAEAHEMNGGMNHRGAFCRFYIEQIRYAFRLLADKTYEDYLWDDWDKDTETTFLQ